MFGTVNEIWLHESRVLWDDVFGGTQMNMGREQGQRSLHDSAYFPTSGDAKELILTDSKERMNRSYRNCRFLQAG
jgi:hypothetical protein